MDRLGDTKIRELRVFLESVVCDLCRFRHAVDDGVPPAGTQIHQEVRLGPGTFADIRIAAGDLPPYFVEVDYGYSRERVVESMRRKYSQRAPASEGASKVIVIVDAALVPEQSALEAEIRGVLAPGLSLEVWDDRQLLTIFRKTFGPELPAVVVVLGRRRLETDSFIEISNGPLQLALAPIGEAPLAVDCGELGFAERGYDRRRRVGRGQRAGLITIGYCEVVFALLEVGTATSPVVIFVVWILVDELRQAGDLVCLVKQWEV